MESDGENQVVTLKGQLKDVKGRLALREKELSYFRKQIETVQEDHENLCKLVTSLKSSTVIQENTILRQQNEQLIRDFDLLERRVNEVASAHLLDSQEKELMALELERLHEDNERKSSDRQRTIEIYEERLEKLRTQLKSEEHESQQLRLEAEVLRQETAEHYSCLETRQQLQSEVSALREAYEGLMKEREQSESGSGTTHSQEESGDEYEGEREPGDEDSNTGLEAGEVVETEYERMRAEVSELRERLMESDVEKHLWKKALQHSLLVCAPMGKKTEAQKFAEEIDERYEDMEFISQIPQRVSELFKEPIKSPLSTARYASPRQTIPKRDGTLSLRVVAKLQHNPEGRELFQAVDTDQIRFIGGSKEVERMFRVDAVLREKGGEVEEEIERLIGKRETSPILILLCGAHESETSSLFLQCVHLTVSHLLSSSPALSFSLSSANETEIIPLYPDAHVSFTEDKGEISLARVKSVEQVEKLIAEIWQEGDTAHRIVTLMVEEGQRSAHIVKMNLEERAGHEVICKVLSALYAQRYHVPLRNSPLTNCIRSSLQFDLRLLSLLSIHQTAIEESLKVLQFANDLLSQRDFAISRQRALALNLPSQTVRKSSPQPTLPEKTTDNSD